MARAWGRTGLAAFAFILQEAPAPQGQEAPAPQARLGEAVPEHVFREFIAGSDGRQRLSDFRGQPVFIVNWTDTDFGLGAATQAKDLAMELVPEGLVLILLDSHNKKDEEILASVMRLFPGSPARLTRTQKLPIAYEDNGPPPDVALIGIDGTLLVAGSYTIDFGKAGKLIKSELKKRKSGWGQHATARAARGLAFGQQKLAAASRLVDEALAAEPEQAELLAVRAELENRFATWAASVDFLMQDGRFSEALEAAQALAATVKGHPEWEQRSAALLEQLQTPEAAAELELERKLAGMLAPLRKKKPADSDVAKLRKFADSAGETRVGLRAQRLAEIAALAVK
jgi:hypothetical protein